ncbi:pseudouridine synthase [Flavobacterium sp. MFBS3-15]|uniref:pseudouridine synthase n=1 Tax=Flavobacterium sp. MFBS3-15 TaxID=2989816 RepID=UPI0022362914|nr:pseudouridine synthase [Flavobacterium sp. MFBS3-15]MCW4468230.1 pseudouridine synthase [Flavobacterium sp. MFBS3-15]
MNNGSNRGGGPGRGNSGRARKAGAGPSKPMNKARKPKPAAKHEDADANKGPKKAGFIKGKGPVDRKPAAPKPAAKKTNPDEIRLNKYISNSGMCSRREADIYIQSGNVKVNGKVVTEMGHIVKITDEVDFDGTRITPEKKEYILLNKPKNFTTAGDDEKDLRNVMELVRAATKAKIQPIGRMDKNTTGLLIFTNDTDMVRKFSQPNQKSFKIYQVSLDKNLKFEDLEKMSQGVTLDGHRLFIDEISYIEGEAKTEIGLKLRTPNVKVVRAIFESFNYDVLKVDRVSFAGLTKKNLPRGNWRFLTDQEVINLKNV